MSAETKIVDAEWPTPTDLREMSADDKTCPVVAAAVAAELERRDRRPCGPTHHLGCACHEARRDAEIEALRAERDEARRRIPRCTGPWLKGSGGHRVYGQCDEPADYIDREDGTTFCETHLPALDRSHADYIGSIADERDALRAELAQLRADRDALRPLVVYATARIEQCRKDEAKFAAGSVAIDAATERRTWQTMLDMMDALADHVIEQRKGEG